MAQFRVGQIVKVVDGPRAGEVTRIKSPLYTSAHYGPLTGRLPPEPVHSLELKSVTPPHENIVAPPRWLRPYYPPAKWEAGDEWIRRLTKQRERA